MHFFLQTSESNTDKFPNFLIARSPLHKPTKLHKNKIFETLSKTLEISFEQRFCVLYNEIDLFWPKGKQKIRIQTFGEFSFLEVCWVSRWLFAI